MAKYVQICNECGTKYFMDDPAQRKSVCDECGKRSIRLIVPILLPEEGDNPGAPAGKAVVGKNEDKGPAESQKQQGTGKRPPSGPQGSGSGPVPSEGEADWKEMMRRHRERLHQEKEAGMTGEARDEKPAERQSGPLCMKVSGQPGSLALRLDDTKGPVFIGRGWTQGQYFEKDNRVSWIHCVFFRMADGKWYVKDMQSSNGTFLCERPGAPETRVSAQEPAALVRGSIIRLGQWDDAVRLEVTEA